MADPYPGQRPAGIWRTSKTNREKDPQRQQCGQTDQQTGDKLGGAQTNQALAKARNKGAQKRQEKGKTCQSEHAA